MDSILREELDERDRWVVYVDEATPLRESHLHPIVRGPTVMIERGRLQFAVVQSSEGPVRCYSSSDVLDDFLPMSYFDTVTDLIKYLKELCGIRPMAWHDSLA